MRAIIPGPKGRHPSAQPNGLGICGNPSCGLKGWIKTKGAAFAGFHWQSGYGAFSVSQSDADSVVAYVRNQAQQHERMTFQEEFRRFLEQHQVAFDERYLWD